jgi:hypothetical protein
MPLVETVEFGGYCSVLILQSFPFLGCGLTDWLSGSGGTGETPSQLGHISGTWVELVEIKRTRFRAAQPLPALSEANVSAGAGVGRTHRKLGSELERR